MAIVYQKGTIRQKGQTGPSKMVHFRVSVFFFTRAREYIYTLLRGVGLRDRGRRQRTDPRGDPPNGRPTAPRKGHGAHRGTTGAPRSPERRPTRQERCRNAHRNCATTGRNRSSEQTGSDGIRSVRPQKTAAERIAPANGCADDRSTIGSFHDRSSPPHHFRKGGFKNEDRELTPFVSRSRSSLPPHDTTSGPLHEQVVSPGCGGSHHPS